MSRVGKIAFFGVAGAAVLGMTGSQSARLKRDYTPLQARIMTVETDCFVESGNAGPVKKGTKRLAYMDCDAAPTIAAGFDYSRSSVKERVTVTYAYVSPVDRQRYKGSFVSRGHGKSGDFRVGGTVPIFVHKKIAARSRTAGSNPFVNNANEI